MNVLPQLCYLMQTLPFYIDKNVVRVVERDSSKLLRNCDESNGAVCTHPSVMVDLVAVGGCSRTKD